MTKELCEKFDGIVIPEYKNYIICKSGEVYSLKRDRFLDKALRKRNPQDINSKHDVFVNIIINGKNATVALHRLLAKAFIPNPQNKETVNHIDGNPSNNSVSNLEWMTQSENSKHSHSIGLVSSRYTGCTKSRLTYIETEVGRYSNLMEAIDKLLGYKVGNTNLSKTAILNKEIVPNTTQVPFTSNGYVWRYLPVEISSYKEEKVTYDKDSISDVEHRVLEDNPRYAVTIDGRVYDLTQDKWLTLTLNRSKNRIPFLTCSLNTSNNVYKIVRVSRLVCKYFSKMWPNIGFKDGNVLNCHVNNLQEINQSHVNNCVVAYKLSWKEDIVASYSSLSEAAAEIGVTHSTLSDCVFANLSIPVPLKGEDVVKFPNKRGGFVYRGLRE